MDDLELLDDYVARRSEEAFCARKRYAVECPVEGRVIRKDGGALKSGLRGIEIMIAIGRLLEETNLFRAIALDVTIDEAKVYATIV